jgi:GTPase SAR1 family protein
MLGDAYFQSRAQLGTALFALSTLAQELNAPAETIETLARLNQNLREPFLFVVVGEVKAGKSSLLNALFGRDFCKVDVLPATDKIYVFKYGAQEQNVAVTETLTECYRPNIFLRDFNIVDTPGTNTIVADHQTITEQFVPLADLVMFVFSVTNPWAASAWQFLDLVQKKWLKKVVFVVQQADLREPREVDAVVQHLRQTIHEKLGADAPVFAVSAKQAFLAKTSGADKLSLLTESNFDKLERHINETVTEGDLRAGKLRSVCNTAQVILGNLGEKARTAHTILRQDAERLHELTLSLEERKEQSMRQVDGILWALTQAYDRAQKQGEKLLIEKLSVTETFRSMFKPRNLEGEFRDRIEGRLEEAIRRQVENSLELMENDLRSVWKQLQETLRKNFALNAPELRDPPDFLQERNRLVQRIELTLLEKGSPEQIQTQLEKLLAQTATWLSVPAGVAAAGGIATVVAALTHAALFDVTGTIAGLAAVTGTVMAIIRKNKVLAEFRRQMAARREQVLSGIEDHIRHAVDMFYQDLGAMFVPLQNFCAAQQKIYLPLLEHVQQMEENLGKIAGELHIHRGPSTS